MFSGSAYSAATWGHQASAVSDHQVLQLEKSALACTGIKPAGRCRAIALAVAFGVLGSPRARLVRETTRDYLIVLGKIESDFRHAWAVAKEILYRDCKVTNVKGLMSNVIYIYSDKQDGLL